MNFNEKTVLVTGGTGSFGFAFVKRILKENIKKLIIFSRDEKKQHDMRIMLSDDRINYIIGDIRDYDSLYKSLSGVDYVFHAAALKQVPSCEFFPLEAVKTNIIGTENVISASIENNVSKVVCLSTDKAVYPINSMGISKAMMEKIALSYSRFDNKSNTIVSVTRYGNVMASRGSVIPVIISQIKNKRPITVTNENMTRFLMSLDNSIDLVLNAFKYAKKGEIFIPKVKSAKIIDLAIALKDLFKASNEIEIIGVRDGEKMHEILITSEETNRLIEHEDFYVILPESSDYESFYSKGHKKRTKNEFSSQDTSINTVEELKKILINQPLVEEALN